MKERIIEVIRGVPIAGKTYEYYVEALAGELENSEFGIQNSELRVAREIFGEIDELVFQHGRGDLADRYFYAEIEKLKKKYIGKGINVATKTEGEG